MAAGGGEGEGGEEVGGLLDAGGVDSWFGVGGEEGEGGGACGGEGEGEGEVGGGVMRYCEVGQVLCQYGVRITVADRDRVSTIFTL